MAAGGASAPLLSRASPSALWRPFAGPQSGGPGTRL